MAQPNPYLGGAINAGGMRALIPEMWADFVLMKRDTDLMMANAFRKWPAKGKGDILHIPEFEDMSVFNKRRETSVRFQTIDPTDYTITCDIYREASFRVEDVAKLFLSENHIQMYRNRQARALAQDKDNFALGMRAAIPPAQYVYCSSDGTAAGNPEPFNPAAILVAIEILRFAKVPLEECRLFVSVEQYTDLCIDPNLINRDYYPGSVMEKGEVGMVYGIRTIVNNAITANTLTGYTNGINDPTPRPTPGVSGSPYYPTQGLAYGLPRGKTGDEAAKPFVTAMLLHPDAILDSTPVGAAGMKVTTGFSVEMQEHMVVATQFYGAKGWRTDHAILIHSAARTAGNRPRVIEPPYSVT